MNVSGKKLGSMVVALAMVIGATIGWAVQPVLAGGTPGVGCSNQTVLDSRIDGAFNRVADIRFNPGLPYGQETNQNITTDGWGKYDTYADLVTPTRDQLTGQHNKIIITPYQNQLGKAVLMKVQIGRGLANDAGQVFLNGVRPLCANLDNNDYGYQVPTADPTYLIFEWSGSTNNFTPMVIDFFNQAANLAHHQAVDPYGVAGTGLIQIWFLS